MPMAMDNLKCGAYLYLLKMENTTALTGKIYQLF
jgi:hypothetical protein